MLQHLVLFHIIELLKLPQMTLAICAFFEVEDVNQDLLDGRQTLGSFLCSNMYQVEGTSCQVDLGLLFGDKGKDPFMLSSHDVCIIRSEGDAVFPWDALGLQFIIDKVENILS